MRARMFTAFAVSFTLSISTFVLPQANVVFAGTQTGHATSSSKSSASTSPKYTAYSRGEMWVGNFSTLTQAEQALDDYPGGFVKQGGKVVYHQPDFPNVDLRFPAPNNVTAASINRFFLQHHSPLVGLGASFIEAQRVYGVNANYLVAHAVYESNWGRSPLAVSDNNLFGYGAYDANPSRAGKFPSLDYAIRYQAWVVRKNYLNPGFSHYVSPTLNGMKQNYASDPSWADGVRAVMNQLAVYLGDTVRSYRQYKPGINPPTVVVEQEPAYFLSGAEAVTLGDPNYGSVPIYANVGDGQLHMFSRSLQIGDTGDDVSTLEQALNDLDGAGLTVDGKFGTNTEAALKQFQDKVGLPVTGVCDYTVWNHLQIASPREMAVQNRVQIDEIMQGMLGANVIQWLHVRGMGWVTARDIQLNNVYRVKIKAQHGQQVPSIPLYGVPRSKVQIATLHDGDTVVCRSLQPEQGYIQITWVDETGKHPLNGFVLATQVQIVPYQ